MRPLRWGAPVAFLIGLSGCGEGQGFVDLDGFMDEVRLKSPGSIEPIPTYPPLPPFFYDAVSLRSPFLPPPGTAFSAQDTGRARVSPDPLRIRHPLERFAVEQFVMVGTMANAEGASALLRVAGGVHRLQVGDYLGRDDGRIVSISETRVDLLEIVADGESAWREQPRSISLNVRS